jgi:hypothetical protein
MGNLFELFGVRSTKQNERKKENPQPVKQRVEQAVNVALEKGHKRVFLVTDVNTQAMVVETLRRKYPQEELVVMTAESVNTHLSQDLPTKPMMMVIRLYPGDDYRGDPHQKSQFQQYIAELVQSPVSPENLLILSEAMPSPQTFTLKDDQGYVNPWGSGIFQPGNELFQVSVGRNEITLTTQEVENRDTSHRAVWISGDSQEF